MDSSRLRVRWSLAIATLTASITTISAGAQTANTTANPTAGRGRFTVEKTTARVRIDAVLDEAIWSEATPIPLPFETQPGDNDPAPVETKCQVAHDADRLYFACRAFDPRPEQIRAFISDRDNAFGHDRVTLVVDPFNDSRRAFNFTVSALGVQLDGVMDQSQGFDGSWDAIWTSAGRITDDGYVVEAAIPFKSLRFPETQGLQTWGMYFQRWWPRTERVQMLSFRWDRGNDCFLCQINLVTGFDGITAGANVEWTPTVTSVRTDARPTPSARIVNGDIDGDVGLDARWGITTDITTNFTVNPDFSQIEADVAQLDVNNQFTLSFPEKRPFFLEGADFFSTPLRAVFTRTIVDPVAGAKITGKINQNAVGALVARDEVTRLVFPGSQGSSTTLLQEDFTAVVGRFRRDVGSSSMVGAMYTGREGRDYHNRVGGVDALIRLTGPLTVDVQYLRSHTQYPGALAAAEGQPAGGFGDDAYRASVQYNTRNWWVQSFYQSLGPEFRADAGFIPQVGIRQFDFRGTRTFWTPEALTTSLSVTSGFGVRTESDGTLLDRFVFADLGFEGPLQSRFDLNPDFFRTQFAGQRFSNLRLNVFGAIRPSGNVGFDIFWQFGDAIDFRNVQQAFQVSLTQGVDLRLGRHLEWSIDDTYQRFTRAGEEIFEAHLLQNRLVYNFNPRTFVRVITQFRSTNRNPELHTETVDREFEALFSQLLFSYKVNPQTVAFVGYSDDRSGALAEDFTRNEFELQSRTFFVKLGYAWRM